MNRTLLDVQFDCNFVQHSSQNFAPSQLLLLDATFYPIQVKLLRPGLLYSIARTALALPSIMTKIDEILLVKQLGARMFDNVIREVLLREALTPPAAGAESNYERLEILGNGGSTLLSFNRSDPFGQAALS